MRVEYKGYIIQTQPNNPRSLEIKNMKSGGSLPLRFSGIFTDWNMAKQTIDAYVNAPAKVKE